LVTVSTEHKCVLAAMSEMEKLGFNLEILNVNRDGSINLDAIENLVSEKTALVSVMHANNEIGVIHPIGEIGKICEKYGALFHTDAAQSAGKVPINIDDQHIDLLSISGHKIYGPKGVGALFIRKEIKQKLLPIIFGGGQEADLRSGTLPTPLCVGLGAAARICEQDMEDDRNKIGAQRDVFWRIVQELTPCVFLNGSSSDRLYNNLNVCFEGVSSQDLLACINERVSASTGSACTSGFIEPSHVLRSIGLTHEQINSSLRFGFGRGLVIEEIENAGKVIALEAERLKNYI